MTDVRARSLFVLAITLATLTACTGPSLLVAPPPGIDLGGHWLLDAKASDDTRAALKHALPTHDAPPAPPPSNFDTGIPDSNRPPGQRRTRQDQQPQTVIVDDTPRLPLSLRTQFATTYVVAPATIELAQSSSGMELKQGDRDRRFASGSDEPTSVTDRYGTRIVRAGWHGSEFEVLTRDSRGLRIEETFRPGRAADTLEVEVHFSAERMKSVHVKSLYRRGNPALEEAGSEGPPETGPR